MAQLVFAGIDRLMQTSLGSDPKLFIFFNFFMK